MGQENLKTLGAVAMVLGLLDVSLGSVLHQVSTTFKKELFIVFIAGALTILSGSFLVCGGRKPAYSCLKMNVCLNLGMVILSGFGFGVLVRHVPYCKGSSCDYVSHDTSVLIGGILAILISIFCVETLISLTVVLMGVCSMFNDYPQQSEDPERIGSTTSEPLCAPAPPPKPGDTWRGRREDGQLISTD